MPGRCSVLHCSTRHTDKITLHRFPNPKKNEDRFKLWVSLTGNKALLEKDPLSVYRNKRICRKHFRISDFVSVRTARDAIPNLNLPEPIEVVMNWKHSPPEETTIVPTGDCWGVSYTDSLNYVEESVNIRSSALVPESSLSEFELIIFQQSDAVDSSILPSHQSQASLSNRPIFNL